MIPTQERRRRGLSDGGAGFYVVGLQALTIVPGHFMSIAVGRVNAITRSSQVLGLAMESDPDSALKRLE
jgi:hypothetical protein